MPINLTVYIKWTITSNTQLTKNDTRRNRKKNRSSLKFVSEIKSEIKYLAMKKTLGSANSVINCFVHLIDMRPRSGYDLGSRLGIGLQIYNVTLV